MELNDLPPEAVERLFELGCFLIINDLPIGSQFSIDGSSSITGPLFQGVKLIPPGFHIISIVPGNNQELQNNADDEGNIRNDGSHVGHLIKTGFLRFFKDREVVIRNYDPQTETLKPVDDHQDTIVSLDYMKALDSRLAPYPLGSYNKWKALTRLIQPAIAQKVFGSDKAGDFILDSTMANGVKASSTGAPRSISGSKLERSRLTWGKPRPEIERPETKKQDGAEETFTNWPEVDIKRSWPKDCIGSELTKWSRDKSWLLDQLIKNELENDYNQLLGLIQLSFSTFVHVLSIQSFESYQLYVSLISKSNPIELFKFSPKYLNLISNLIKILLDQFEDLHSEFFQKMEDFQIENWFFDSLNRLRQLLNQIFKGGDEDTKRMFLKSYNDQVKNDWKSLQEVCKKFDWNVKSLRVEEGKTESESEDEEELSGSEFEDEDDENKPVVVEL